MSPFDGFDRESGERRPRKSETSKEFAKLPRVFRTLASAVIWVLFLGGCVAILAGLPVPFLWNGEWRYMALGFAGVFLSTVAIRIRRSLE